MNGHIFRFRLQENELSSVITQTVPLEFGSLDLVTPAQKIVNFTHIQMTCDQLVSTCAGWPNGKKLASI